MKKIAAIVSVSLLSACVHAGNIDVLPFRNSVFSVWQTEKIDYYDKTQGDEYLMESKTITEDKIEKKQVLVTPIGGIMASSKTYRTDFFATETLKLNKNGAMSSSYSPLYLKKENKFEGFGQVELNGETFMTVRQGNDGDVLLVNGDGEINSRVGRLVDGRLSLLDIVFFVEPSDVRLTPVVQTRSETSEVLDGFELRYEGINGKYMRFVYQKLGVDPSAEEILFPIDEETVEIENLKIRVFEAAYDKIEYMIL